MFDLASEAILLLILLFEAFWVNCFHKQKKLRNRAGQQDLQKYVCFDFAFRFEHTFATLWAIFACLWGATAIIRQGFLEHEAIESQSVVSHSVWGY